jgi:Tol biopolymer transport system component
MRKKRVRLAMSLLVIALVAVAFTSGCGGGTIAGAATVIAQHENGKTDNPIIALPKGHLKRIVFASDRDPASDKDNIFAMDPDGGNVLEIAYNAKGSSRIFSFSSPSISQDGLTAYFASDWYASSTQLLSISINGASPTRLTTSVINYENERVSWDAVKMAFAGYVESTVTGVVNPDTRLLTKTQYPSSGDDPALKGQFGMTGSGYRLLSSVGTKGILNAGTSSVTCSALSGYTTSLDAYGTDGGTSLMPGFDPMNGRYFCINVDDTNYILMHLTAYTYSQTMKTTCALGTSTADEHGSLEFTWTWQPEGITGSGVLNGSCSGKTKYGQGYNFLRTHTNRDYDLYAADIDGGNVTRLTTGVDSDWLPCFSPYSDSNTHSHDYFFFTRGVISTDKSDYRYMDYTEPVSSHIYKYDLTNNEITQVTDGDALDRGCAFSPGGNYMAFSRMHGSDYDIYVKERNDFSAYNVAAWPLTNICDTSASALGSQKGDDLNPVFSPEGSRLAFQSDLTNDNDIYTINLDLTTNCAKLTNLTNNYDEDTNPGWAP